MNIKLTDIFLAIFSSNGEKLISSKQQTDQMMSNDGLLGAVASHVVTQSCMKSLLMPG